MLSRTQALWVGPATMTVILAAVALLLGGSGWLLVGTLLGLGASYIDRAVQLARQPPPDSAPPPSPEKFTFPLNSPIPVATLFEGNWGLFVKAFRLRLNEPLVEHSSMYGARVWEGRGWVLARLPGGWVVLPEVSSPNLPGVLRVAQEVAPEHSGLIYANPILLPALLCGGFVAAAGGEGARQIDEHTIHADTPHAPVH